MSERKEAPALWAGAPEDDLAIPQASTIQGVGDLVQELHEAGWTEARCGCGSDAIGVCCLCATPLCGACSLSTSRGLVCETHQAVAM